MKTLHSYVVEMADPIKKVKQILLDHIGELIENWCLVRYCRDYANYKVLTVNHWKTELITHMSVVITRQLKSGSHKGIIEQVFNELNLDPDTISKNIETKFKKEKLQLDNLNDISNDFISELGDIKHAMYSSKEEIIKYVKEEL